MPSLAPVVQNIRGPLFPVCLILILQTAVSHSLSVPERLLPLPGLRSLPSRLGEWEQGAEQVLEPNAIAYLRPDEYILRDYVNRSSGASVNLFIAYFKSLEDGYGPHSPRVCLPGAGWLVRSTRAVSIPGHGGSPTIPVNEYIIEKAGNRVLVVYWYQNERDVWADEFWEKIRMLPDLIRYHRSDLSLVRVISATTPEGTDFSNCLQFTRELVPVLAKRFELVP